MINTIPQTFDAYDSSIRVGSLTGFRLRRRFTDLFCCLSYLLLIGACVGLVLYNQGNAVPSFEKLRDSSHRPCTGVHNFLYFPTPSLDNSVCAANCPDQAGVPINCKPNHEFPTCPTSIAGLVSNYELNICHHPQAQIPLTTMGRVLNNSIFNAKSSIIWSLVATAAVAFFLVLTIVLYPSLVYLYLIVFEFIMIAISAGCFYRFFIGRLPFVDESPHSSFKGSYYALGLGVLFLISSIVSITMLVTRFPAIQFTIKILRLARLVVFDNPLILLNSIVLTLISIGVFLLNFWLYQQIESFGTIDTHSKGLDQYHGGLAVYLLRALFLIQALWTHGFIISLSHFIFEANASIWYYSQLLGADECYSFVNTIKLIFWHFGTICYGSFNTYHLQSVTNAINQSQQWSNPGDFETCCCFYNSCFRYLSIYGFIPTVLEGLPFYLANNRFSLYKRLAEESYPELYMQGSFFTNSAKFFVTVLSTLIVYLQLVHSHPDLYFHFRALVIPLIITAFVAHEIATAWLDATGTVGDSILFNKVIDANSGAQYLRGNPLAVQILHEKVQLPVMSVY